MKKRANRKPARRNGAPLWSLNATGAITMFIGDHPELKVVIAKELREAMDDTVREMHRANELPAEVPAWAAPKARRGAKQAKLPMPPAPRVVVPVTRESVLRRSMEGIDIMRFVEAHRLFKGFLMDWVDEVSRGPHGSVGVQTISLSYSVLDGRLALEFRLMGEDFGENERHVEVPESDDTDDIYKYLTARGADQCKVYAGMRYLRKYDTIAWVYDVRCAWPIDHAKILRSAIGEHEMLRMAQAAVDDPGNDPNQ